MVPCWASTSGANSDSSICPTVKRSRCPCNIRVNFATLVLSQSCSWLRSVVTRRLSRVYPVYRVGFEHDLEALDGWLSTKQRLLVFGRQGLFVQDNTHHVLAMGMAAADALTPDGGFDHMRWRRALDRFAGHIVED